MQYHLDTIPVWEVMEAQTECPLCALAQKTEQQEIVFRLGGSVMEPAVREHANELGYCQEHHEQLFLQSNRLGHALLTDSHTIEVLKKLDKLPARISPQKRSLLGSGRDSRLVKLAEGLEALTDSCVICDAVQQHMNRYLYTFVHLWKKEEKFRETLATSQGLCIPHVAQLLRQAAKSLPKGQWQAFEKCLLTQLKTTLQENEKSLEWFTLKFDYRNQDKPWGNSKNALQRTVNRLRGKCLGED